MKKEILYLAVTADKYELPLTVCSNLDQLAKFANRSINDIKSSIARKSYDTKNKCKYVKVDMTEDLGMEM